jgi:hypothetical protein
MVPVPGVQAASEGHYESVTDHSLFVRFSSVMSSVSVRTAKYGQFEGLELK